MESNRKQVLQKVEFSKLTRCHGRKACSNSSPSTHWITVFFCYKKTFNVVILCLIDANFKFIYSSRCGRNSEGSIFKHSNFGKKLLGNEFGFPPSKALPGSNQVLPHVIIGDEAFPLCTNLMRPYSREAAQGDEEKKVFNYRLSRARNVSEN